MTEQMEVLTKIAQSMAASPYPYSGAGMVCLPDKQITRQELWDSLSETERDTFLNYAYAAFRVMGDYGYMHVMNMAFEDYIKDK